MDSVRLYFRYVGISIRAQMQYRLSCVMMAAGQFALMAMEFVAVWALFQRFSSLGGWSLREVAILYGLVNMSFAIAEGVARGFDIFPGMVKSGDFDRILLRPRSTALQVSALEVQLMRVGRFAQGLIVFLWAARGLNVDWNAARIGLVFFAVGGGACLFTGLFVIQATLSFWSTESLEVVNTTTYGGVDTGKFPISIYPSWFRRFFTFVIPLACVTYFPALAITGKTDAFLASPEWFHWSAPALGVVFLFAGLHIWRLGVRHYRSTGS